MIWNTLVKIKSTISKREQDDSILLEKNRHVDRKMKNVTFVINESMFQWQLKLNDYYSSQHN